MKKNIVKFSLVGVMMLASLLTCLAIRHASREKLEQIDAQLAVQSQQIDALTADNARLTKISRTPEAPPMATTDELQKLRTEVQSLQQQVATAEQQARAASQAATANAKAPVQHTDEYWKQLRAMSGGKQSDAMKLGFALMDYAVDHGGQFPTSFDQVSQHLPKDGLNPNVANEFDIVYTGTMDAVKDLPNMEVPVLRQRQAWPGPDGTKMERIYVFMGGMSTIVESEDNFQSWEAAHLINATDTAESTRQ
ncbi:MAG TPA: hypothetical protein VFB72_17715 [Verrucomicrobiae bacterium]|nr:hypothetical protein [Verrucomicrobiae bacterium]